MAISPILINGTIQQTNDVLLNQTKETHKAALDQGNIYNQELKQEHQRATKVVTSDEARFQDKKHDAKEKGSNSYSGDGGRRRKSSDSIARIIDKSEGGFDIKV